jgi:hypothetical protein
MATPEQWAQKTYYRRQHINRVYCSTFEEAQELLDGWPTNAAGLPAEYYLAVIDQFQIVPLRSNGMQVFICWHIASLAELEK